MRGRPSVGTASGRRAGRLPAVGSQCIPRASGSLGPSCRARPVPKALPRDVRPAERCRRGTRMASVVCILPRCLATARVTGGNMSEGEGSRPSRRPLRGVSASRVLGRSSGSIPRPVERQARTISGGLPVAAEMGGTRFLRSTLSVRAGTGVGSRVEGIGPDGSSEDRRARARGDPARFRLVHRERGRVVRTERNRVMGREQARMGVWDHSSPVAVTGAGIVMAAIRPVVGRAVVAPPFSPLDRADAVEGFSNEWLHALSRTAFPRVLEERPLLEGQAQLDVSPDRGGRRARGGCRAREGGEEADEAPSAHSSTNSL